MVVATLRAAIEDPLTAKQHQLPSYETVKTGEEPFFLDGPVGARVAVVDRDPETGQLATAARWLGRARTYQVPEDLREAQAMAASVFGIVMETLEVFERNDVLGHKVKWAFDSPQLLVVPRAGVWENAFYDRSSRSLQFFFFDRTVKRRKRRVHTALSRDIVAHETGHAILDGLAPALYDALTPQSLGLHEAIGDLTAIVMALHSPAIRRWLVQRHSATLTGDTPVSRLADEFGWGVMQEHRPLRDANNSVKLDPSEREPHELCKVLVGAVWAAMVQLQESARESAEEEAKGERLTLAQVEEKTLWVSARRISRILFRALDYLPPAEATFADYATALLRADEVAYPVDETGYRATLLRQFIDRRIVAKPSDLQHSPAMPALAVELDDLVESEWMAYEFANRNRELLGIGRNLPPRRRNRIPFRLFPRRRLTRRYYLGRGKHEDREEVVFQVTWEEPEPNIDIPGVPPTRAVFHGTTLVLGAEPNAKGLYPVHSCLTSDGAGAHVRARNDMLGELVDKGRLRIADTRETPDRRQPYSPKVLGRLGQNMLRLRGTARMLHLAGGEEEDG